MRFDPRPVALRWAGRLLLGYAAFVVYGSLLPFEFRPQSLADAWSAFGRIPFLELGIDARADWVANGVLYAPLGALGTIALRRSGGVAAAVAAWVGASFLALTVEFAQLFFPPRTVSLNDVVAEVLGAALGAVAASWASPRLHDAPRAGVHGAARWLPVGLAAYPAALVLYSLFPFDVLLTRDEWDAKLSASGWAWGWAAMEGQPASVRLFSTLAEVLAAVPVGMAVASQRIGARNAWRGAWAGAAIGLAIELGQLALFSGTSQGASVLTRALGGALGAAWFGRPHRLGFESMRHELRRHAGWLGAAYLLALPFAAGWLRHDWAGPAQAQQAWAQLRLMPFYYHYHTTEAIALTSLARIAAVFAPLGALAWAWRAGAAGAGAAAAALAAVLEAGKLFQPATHADPTNVLIAAVAAAVTARLLSFFGTLQDARGAASASIPIPIPDSIPANALASASAPAPAANAPPASSAPRPPVSDAWPGANTAPRMRADDHGRAAWAGGRAAGVLVLVAVLLVAATWPAQRAALVAVLAAASVAVLVRPALALAVLPLAMPVFDLAPWTGRFFVDEFDLLCASVLSIAWLRMRGDRGPRPAPLPPLSRAAVGLFAVSLLLSLARGWAGAAGADVGTLSHLHSAANGLRAAKGAAWALAFAWIYRRQLDRDPQAASMWSAGLAGGLALTVAIVVWERAAFVSLLDFNADYRVSGMFSAMVRGGAFIECFLAVAASASLAGWTRQRSALASVLTAALFVAAVYALVVTYSRNGYAALAAGTAVVLAGVLANRAVARRRRVGLAVAVLAAAALGAAMLSGGFAQQRLKRSAQDLDVRAAHWRVALSLRDDSWATGLLGVGPGRFSERHLWAAHGESRAAPYAIGREGGNAFLRLGVGASVYVEQIVAAPPGAALRLSADLRSAAGTPALHVIVCRKWTMTSQDCQAAQLTSAAPTPGRWQTQHVTVPALPPPPSAAASWLPVKLSLVTPAKAPAIDVDNVVLRPDGGPATDGLIANGGFESGMDRWFFATDLDPPWHIHSLPVAVLFDQGWLGVAAWSTLLAASALAGLRALRAGSPAGTAALAGVAAFATSGMLNTLIDEPRFLWLLLTSCALCLIHGARADARRQASAGPPAMPARGRPPSRTGLSPPAPP